MFYALAVLTLSFLPSPAPPPGPGREPLPTTAKDDDFSFAEPIHAPRDAPQGEKQNFVINDETEVRLDGKACKFADVPPGAAIVSLAVAADKKTILRIECRTKAKE